MGKTVSPVMLVLLTTCFLAWAFTIQLGNAASTLLYINPAITYAPSPGMTFCVDVDVSDVEYLYDWQANLTWNPSVLSFANVAEGPFLADQPEGTYGACKNGTGWALFGWTTLGFYIGVSGSGTLATVEFKVLATGESVLDFIEENEAVGYTFLEAQTSPVPPPHYEDIEFTAQNGLVIADLPVHNINTGEDFPTIQEAIDDPDTLDGHTILVDAGTCYESVTVDKAVSIVGESPSTTIVDGGGSQNVFEVVVSGVVIENFTVMNGGIHGILLNGWGTPVNQCVIRNNNVLHNSWGICAGGPEATDNIISGNRVTDNHYGIAPADWANHNIIAGNEVMNNYYGIGLIDLVESNIVSGNNIADNEYGIMMTDGAKYNIVFGNNISNNECGVDSRPSNRNNTFYHNNFVDNTIQVYIHWEGEVHNWDDGYPSGGNYWSDYTAKYPLAEDEFHGENQTVAGSDGVWDSPYEIDVDNQDRYPLVEPWDPPKIPGDINKDGIVNVEDLTIVAMAYGCECEDLDYDRQGDLNFDGWVEMHDLSTVARNLLKTSP